MSYMYTVRPFDLNDVVLCDGVDGEIGRHVIASDQLLPRHVHEPAVCSPAAKHQQPSEWRSKMIIMIMG